MFLIECAIYCINCIYSKKVVIRGTWNILKNLKECKICKDSGGAVIPTQIYMSILWHDDAMGYTNIVQTLKGGLQILSTFSNERQWTFLRIVIRFPLYEGFLQLCLNKIHSLKHALVMIWNLYHIVHMLSKLHTGSCHIWTWTNL